MNNNYQARPETLDKMHILFDEEIKYFQIFNEI